jgi:sugar transferase (PEP-CTERM/EpsH1 system associated)
MRILFLTSRVPYPPDRGDRLRAFNFIKHLSREHDLSLVSFIAQDYEREHLAILRNYCQDVRVVMKGRYRSATTVFGNLWRSDPLQVLYYRSQVMRQLVDEMLGKARFDAIYIHLFRMAPYVMDHTELYRIVDLTDVISKEIDRSLPYRGLVSRLIYGIEKPRIARYEQWVARNFEEIWLISEADREILAACCPTSNIQVIANGVDLEHFFPTDQPCQPNSLVFVGHLGVFHNVDAANYLVRDILPLVQQRVPDCTLKIVGADPGPSVWRLAQVPGVSVNGFVPDLNPVLNESSVFVAPLRFAAGVQNKVLEAMAAGRPVVTTTVVNDGLGARSGEDILVGDDPRTIADQIVTLLQNKWRREQIGQGGLLFVRRKYRWDYVLERMRNIEKRLGA